MAAMARNGRRDFFCKVGGYDGVCLSVCQSVSLSVCLSVSLIFHDASSRLSRVSSSSSSATAISPKPRAKRLGGARQSFLSLTCMLRWGLLPSPPSRQPRVKIESMARDEDSLDSLSVLF
jgi:hypothetical protein